MWILLMPFLVLVLVYFVVEGVPLVGYTKPSVRSAVLKCLPILYLMALCYSSWAISPEHAKLRRWILLGLLTSMAGDWFLNWFKTLFIQGALCFAMAHVVYILGFGLSPLGVEVGFVFGVFALVMAKVVWMKFPPQAYGTRLVAVCYVFVICTMGWRACVLYLTQQTTASMLGAVGAMTFILSDTLIAMNKGRTKMARGEFYIMTTYYVAQLLLTLAVVLPSLENPPMKPTRHL